MVPFDHSQTLGLCESCHNGVIASDKSPVHVETKDDCGSCHTTTSWFVAGGNPNEPPPREPAPEPTPTPIPVDHNAFIDSCISCHNNRDATGKPDTHPLTTDVCESCHAVTHWLPVMVPFDHSQTTDSCANCHNGSTATGKSANHIATTLDCDVCHTSSSWLPPQSGT
jgi:hypothetical protein